MLILFFMVCSGGFTLANNCSRLKSCKLLFHSQQRIGILQKLQKGPSPLYSKKSALGAWKLRLILAEKAAMAAEFELLLKICATWKLGADTKPCSIGLLNGVSSGFHFFEASSSSSLAKIKHLPKQALCTANHVKLLLLKPIQKQTFCHVPQRPFAAQLGTNTTAPMSTPCGT